MHTNSVGSVKVTGKIMVAAFMSVFASRKKIRRILLRTKEASLQKYTHYYRLFNEHENSAKLDMKLGQTVEQKVRVLQDSLGISWIEGQFLPESIRTLIEGRTALKWSFPLAYYSDQSHNMTKIFIENQMLLVNAVENLSQLLQIKNPQQMMDKKLDFYNKARFVKSRELALVECGRELLMKGICCAPG